MGDAVLPWVYITCSVTSHCAKYSQIPYPVKSKYHYCILLLYQHGSSYIITVQYPNTIKYAYCAMTSVSLHQVSSGYSTILPNNIPGCILVLRSSFVTCYLFRARRAPKYEKIWFFLPPWKPVRDILQKQWKTFQNPFIPIHRATKTKYVIDCGENHINML